MRDGDHVAGPGAVGRDPAPSCRLPPARAEAHGVTAEGDTQPAGDVTVHADTARAHAVNADAACADAVPTETAPIETAPSKRPPPTRPRRCAPADAATADAAPANADPANADPAATAEAAMPTQPPATQPPPRLRDRGCPRHCHRDPPGPKVPPVRPNGPTAPASGWFSAAQLIRRDEVGATGIREIAAHAGAPTAPCGTFPGGKEQLVNEAAAWTDRYAGRRASHLAGIENCAPSELFSAMVQQWADEYGTPQSPAGCSVAAATVDGADSAGIHPRRHGRRLHHLA